MKRAPRDNVAFEDALNDDWNGDLDVVEVPLGNKPLFYLGVIVAAIVVVVAGRIVYLNGMNGAYYAARAEDNVAQYTEAPAPRGTIYDSEGDVLAKSKAAFAAVLDMREYLDDASLQSSTASVAQEALGIAPADLAALVGDASANDFVTPIVLAENLTQKQLVDLQAAALPTITVENDFTREYPNGPVFSSVVGYTGRVSGERS